MRSIHRILSRAAVLAAAGLVAASFSARSASAATVYTTGFEPSPANPAFTTGAVSGQGSFVQDSVGSPFTSTATVTTSAPIDSGVQALDISRAVANSIGDAPLTHITQASPFTVTAQVRLNIPTFTGGTPNQPTGGGNGPFFGLNLWGNNGGTEIGSFGIDAGSGDIFDSANGPGSFLLSDGSAGAPFAVTADTWHTLNVVANFTSGAGGPVTLTYSLDGTVVDTETTTPTYGSFDFAYLWGQEGFQATTDTAGLGAFDNFSVSTSAAVPEPTSMAVVGVAGMLLSLRRSRRGSVAAK